jgi:hypothetical protein
VDVETTLTSPNGFGLERATLLQRAKARIKDGIPLADLLARASEHERRCVETAIGCAASMLPTGAPPIEILETAPVRTGKSLEDAALAVTRTQTVTINPDLIQSGQEPPRVSVLATELDQASTIRGHLNIVNERPALRALKVGETDDSVTLRHPSGMPIEIKVIAAKRGGYSIASRWSASVIFDEAPGWHSTDKVVSLEESREQALGRLIDGAQCIYTGSKWQPSGLCYDMWAEYLGKPTADLVVISPQEVDGVSPATQLNPVYWTPERIDRIRRTSPRTFAMHAQNMWGAAGNSAFTVDEIDAVISPDLPEGTLMGTWFCAIDASALRHDSFAAVFAVYCYPNPEPIVKGRPFDNGRGVSGTVIPLNPEPADFVEQIKGPVLRVHDVMGFRPPGVKTLDVVSAVAAKCKRYGIRVVFGDQFESGSLAGLFSHHQIGLRTWHWDRPLKDEAIAGTLRRLYREQRISQIPHDLLRRQLLSIREIPSPGGTWRYPTGGLDCASALITLAMALNDPEVLGARTDASVERFNSPTSANYGGRTIVSGR